MGKLSLKSKHRILVDDCSIKENLYRLIGEDTVDMCYCDPPYGINLDTDYTKMGDTALKHNKVIGDDKEFDPSHLFDVAPEVFLFGANYYCWHLPRGGSWVCWDKRSQGEEKVGMMDDMFGSDFEMCWSKVKHQNKLARVLKPTGRYAINTDERFVHPCQKPVALAEYFFTKWGKESKTIFNGYLGSGTALIACEKTERCCLACEIDPQYGDVIITRYIRYCGKQVLRRELDGTKTDVTALFSPPPA